MIHAYSVLVGYVSMRGSFAVHLPMFIAMLSFVSPFWGDQVPSSEDMQWSTPGAQFWIYYGLFIHLVLAVMHFTTFMSIDPRFTTYRLIAQILGVLGQVFNFCVLSNLYADLPTVEIMNDT